MRKILLWVPVIGLIMATEEDRINMNEVAELFGFYHYVSCFIALGALAAFQ